MSYSRKRQRFLVNQGYAYKVSNFFSIEVILIFAVLLRKLYYSHITTVLWEYFIYE